MPQDEPQSAVENSVGFLDLLKIKRPFVCLLRFHSFKDRMQLITHIALFFGQIMATPFPMRVYFGESVY